MPNTNLFDMPENFPEFLGRIAGAVYEGYCSAHEGSEFCQQRAWHDARYVDCDVLYGQSCHLLNTLPGSITIPMPGESIIKCNGVELRFGEAELVEKVIAYYFQDDLALGQSRSELYTSMLRQSGLETFLNAIVTDSGALLADRSTPQPNHTYRIRCQHSDLLLDVFAGSQDNGATVCQAILNYTAAQVWSLEMHPVYPSTYLLRVQSSQKCLDVYAGGRASGDRVVQADYNGTPAQAWRIEPHPAHPGYYLLTAVHSGLCLDVKNGALNNAAEVCQAEYNATGAQAWKFSRVV